MTDTADTPLLSAHELVIALPGDPHERVVSGVSFALAEGEVVDIVGPSGSGKTTFLRALARLLPGVTGTLTLQGRPAEQIDVHDWRSRVALLPQKPVIVPGSIADNLLLPWTLKVRHEQQPPGAESLQTALASVGLGEMGVDRDASRLSVGQQARIALLRVMMTSPLVLLLDEADAALDDVSAACVRERVEAFASRGAAVVRVRHRGDDGLAVRRLRLQAGTLEREG